MSINSGQEQHEMRLVKTHSSGAEEWFCPTCERRFLMQWPPKYKKIVLQAGDEYAMHNGAKGGLQIGSLDIGEAQEPVLSDELRAALEEILEDIDTEDSSSTVD